MVGDVEGLNPELHLCLVAERETLVERGVEAAEAGAVDTIARLIPELTGVGNRIEPLERRGRHPLRNLVRRSFVRVSGDIGAVAKHAGDTGVRRLQGDVGRVVDREWSAGVQG